MTAFPTILPLDQLKKGGGGERHVPVVDYFRENRRKFLIIRQIEHYSILLQLTKIGLNRSLDHRTPRSELTKP